MLLLGEIRTCVLRNSGSLVHQDVARVLQLLPGERVSRSERPIAHAISPDLVTGVDCPLPTVSGTKCRGVGTVSARAVITGGHILQGSAHVRVDRGTADHRLPWSHYLARPGVVQTIGRFEPDDVIKGFLAVTAPETTLDLGAVSERLIAGVQLNPGLDHVVPLRAKRTRMRWTAKVAQVGASGYGGEFTIADDVVRTMSVSLEADDLDGVVGFCENLAMHDWVLTTVLRIVERSGAGVRPGPEITAALRPAIDHLIHLWMPGAHVSEALLPLWDSLERRSGFSRQWRTTVARIRDQLALHRVGA